VVLSGLAAARPVTAATRHSRLKAMRDGLREAGRSAILAVVLITISPWASSTWARSSWSCRSSSETSTAAARSSCPSWSRLLGLYDLGDSGADPAVVIAPKLGAAAAMAKPGSEPCADNHGRGSSQWRFDPGRSGSEAVAVGVLIPVEFRLKSKF
jgi:hypothetical protein